MVLLAAPAGANHIFRFETAFGSGIQAGGRFVEATGIATDGAGRVYVADRGARRVEVYDSAAGGHRLLRTLGDGRLTDPVDVDVDERDRAYVSDAGAHRVDVYDQFIRGSVLLDSHGEQGSEGGQLFEPRHIAVDRGARVHVVERGNQRVSIFRSLANGGGIDTMFRIGQPPVFEAPDGIALDPSGSMYLTNASEREGRIRWWVHNGAFGGEFGSPGSGPGQLSAPSGLVIDGAGRVVVADSGNDRIQVFDAQRAPVDRYGTSGGGANQFERPLDVALAPGSLLYVVDQGNGRVVRLRYDDADGDGITGARDNCRRQFNARQDDADADGVGDACDDDSDGDRVPSSSDLCPYSRPLVDRNRDGCGDPRSQLSLPRDRGTYEPTRAATIRGRAFGDQLGIAGVEVALRRLQLSGEGRSSGAGRCLWYSPRLDAFVPGSCSRPKFFPVNGRSVWSARLRAGALRPGLYSALSRARQEGGLSEARWTPGRNLARFRVSG